MKAPLLALLFLTTPLYAQQNPYAAACGATAANYSIKDVTPPPLPTQLPPGKALVYIIDTTQGGGLFTTKVNIGLDGNWLGAIDRNSYISFTVDPGVHHLCTVYQGQAHPMQDGDQTLLIHLNAEAGKTYYLHYQSTFFNKSDSIALFTPTDEDEGPLLLQLCDLAVSKLKK